MGDNSRPSWRHPRAHLRALRASGMWTFTDGGRFRHWLWGRVQQWRSICPATSHSVIVWGYLEDPRIDDMCRQDCALNGCCWCGKLARDKAERQEIPA